MTHHVSKQLARQASRSIAAWRRADAAGMPTEAHTDRLAALGAEVQFHPCGSPEGVLFQFAVLEGAVACAIERGDLPDSDARMIDRLFANVRHFIEDSTGLPAADLGLAGFYYRTGYREAANENNEPFAESQRM